MVGWKPVAIVGAGPTGIACADRARTAARSPRSATTAARILDSIYHFPEEMRWFSTRDLLDIAGVPFGVPGRAPDASRDARPTTAASPRGSASRRFRRPRSSAIQPGTAGVSTSRSDGRLGERRFAVPGGDPRDRLLPQPAPARRSRARISRTSMRRYVSGYPFHGRDVVVVGGKNSAAEAALDLYRHGARVTLVVRGARHLGAGEVLDQAGPGESDRAPARSARSSTPRSWRSARSPSASRRRPGGESIPADAVFPLIGYEPDFALFERCGIRLEGPESGPRARPRDARVQRPRALPGRRDPRRPRGRAHLHREQPAPRGPDRAGNRGAPPARPGAGLTRGFALQPFGARACFSS